MTSTASVTAAVTLNAQIVLLRLLSRSTAGCVAPFAPEAGTGPPPSSATSAIDRSSRGLPATRLFRCLAMLPAMDK